MEKMEERCFAADRDIAYIVLKTNMGMNEKLAKEWAAAVQAAAVHACGLVRALIEHVIYDYFMLERYSEALMEAELQQYNRNIEQLGEPLRIRKGNGTGESFYSLVKMVNDEGCAHLPEEQKEWFTIDMVYYNVLYEALKMGDAAWAELKPAEHSNFSVRNCMLLLTAWMQKHAEALGEPNVSSLSDVAFKIACMDQLGYAGRTKLLLLRFAANRHVKKVKQEGGDL